MNRRTLLRAGAAATAGGLATAAGLAVGSEPADAQASTTLDVAGDSVVLDGSSIAAVQLTLDVEWAYDLPSDRQPESVTVEIAAGPSDGGLTTVADAESAQLFVEASGSESFDVDLLSEGALDAESLTPDSGSRATDVTSAARRDIPRHRVAQIEIPHSSAKSCSSPDSSPVSRKSAS